MRSANLLFVLLLASSLRAEPVKIVVQDAEQRPIAGADVVIGDAAGTTASDGALTLEVAEGTEPLSVVASANEFEDFVLDVARAPTITIVLKRGERDVLVVIGRRVNDSPSPRVLLPDDILRMPGARGDALVALQSLPGAARMPFGIGGFSIRGLSPRESGVFIDGVEVPLAFHFIGITATYPTPLLDRLALQPGGFGAHLGRYGGSIIELATREPRRDHRRIGGEVSLLHSAATLETPLFDGKAGLVAGIRRSYIDVLGKPFTDLPIPSYTDLQVRASWGHERGLARLAPFAYASWDRAAADDGAVNLAFARTGIEARRWWQDGVLTATPWAGLNELAFTSDDEDIDAETVRRSTYLGGVTANWERDLSWGDGGDLRIGGDAQGGYLGVLNIGPFVRDSQTWLDVGTFVDARIRLAQGDVEIRPGVRLDYFGLVRDVALDPRLAGEWRVNNELVLRGATGLYHQAPSPTEVLGDGSALLPSRTFQSMATAEVTLPNRLLLSGTLFWNESRALPVFASDEDFELDGLSVALAEIVTRYLGDPEPRATVGKGRSAGLEVSSRWQTNDWQLIGAYTFLKAKRTEAPPNTEWHPYALDQTHKLHLAASWRGDKWMMGSKFTLATGLPYSPTIDFAGTRTPYGARLPTFMQMDARVDRFWRSSRGTWTLFVDVQNVLMRQNVEGRSTDIVYDQGGQPIGFANDDIHGLPLLPIVGVSFTPS